MLTAVEPGLDILEMDFDDYLCKPIEKSDLVAAIEQQLRVQRYDDRVSEYFEIAHLRERAKELKADLDESLGEFDDIDTAFREIARHAS
jgi:DNA-binding response OmpR family regulator